MKNKFFFFDKFFVSKEPKDMLAFNQNPTLLRDMLNKNIGLVDRYEGDEDIVSLGLFKPETVEAILSNNQKRNFSVTVEDYKANSIRLKVTTDHKGLFVYTDMWDKGWQVVVDGKKAPLRKAFHAFKSVVLSEGSHEIKFIYTNKSFLPIVAMNITFGLCLVGLFLCIALISRIKNCN